MTDMRPCQEFTHARWGSFEGDGSPACRTRTRVLRTGAISLAAKVLQLEDALIAVSRAAWRDKVPAESNVYAVLAQTVDPLIAERCQEKDPSVMRDWGDWIVAVGVGAVIAASVWLLVIAGGSV